MKVRSLIISFLTCAVICSCKKSDPNSLKELIPQMQGTYLGLGVKHIGYRANDTLTNAALTLANDNDTGMVLTTYIANYGSVTMNLTFQGNITTKDYAFVTNTPNYAVVTMDSTFRNVTFILGITRHPGVGELAEYDYWGNR